MLGHVTSSFVANVARERYALLPAFFDAARSRANATAQPRRVIHVICNAANAGDRRERYYADKRDSYPPGCERRSDREHVYRV